MRTNALWLDALDTGHALHIIEFVAAQFGGERHEVTELKCLQQKFENLCQIFSIPPRIYNWRSGMIENGW